MSWIFLSIAIVFEVGGTSCMKLSMGLTRLWPSVSMFGLYAISFAFLTLALKQIPVSVAYAIWSGVGIILISIIDVFVFKTNLSPVKLAAIGLIVSGAFILKWVSNA